MNIQTEASFLALPHAVRTEIYTWSGLTRPCPIDLVSECHRRKHGCVVNDACYGFDQMKTCTYLTHQRDSRTSRPQPGRAHFICYGPMLPLSLFRVCRAVYLEASQLFYSSNKFQLRVLRESDLSCIPNLGLHAISSLRSLHIDLGGWQANRFTLDTSGTSKRYEELIHRWKSTVQAIAQPIFQSSLNLGFTCRPADLEVAKQLLESLECLPLLRGCAIALGGRRAEILRPFVHATAAQLLGHLPMSGQFRFEDLPKELRLKILEQTNLVPKKHTSSTYGVIQIYGDRGRLYTRRKCCSQCNDCLESCCCIWQPAAYSRTCICTYLETALFTVNRQMSREAQEVFFSQNLFILSGPLDSVSFLEAVNQTQLARIQRIEIHILHVNMPWCYNKAESEEKWYQLVRTIRTKLNLCRLELRINLVDVNVPKSNLNPNSRKGFLDMNQEVLRPLK